MTNDRPSSIALPVSCEPRNPIMSRTAYGSRTTSCAPGARSRGFCAAFAFATASVAQPAMSSVPMSSEIRCANAEPASPIAASSASLVVAGA